MIFETFVAQGRGPRISECHIMPPGYWNKGHRHEQSTHLDGRVGVISHVLAVEGGRKTQFMFGKVYFLEEVLLPCMPASIQMKEAVW